MSRCPYLNLLIMMHVSAEMWIKNCSEQYRRGTDVLEGNEELTTEAFQAAWEVRDAILSCPLYTCAIMLSSIVDLITCTRKRLNACTCTVCTNICMSCVSICVDSYYDLRMQIY